MAPVELHTSPPVSMCTWLLQPVLALGSSWQVLGIKGASGAMGCVSAWLSGVREFVSFPGILGAASPTCSPVGFRGAGIGHGGGEMLPSYIWFKRYRSRGTDTCASVLQQVWAGVHLISLHPPWIPAQGPWRSWAALPGKSCCSYPAQATPSSSVSRAAWAFPVPHLSAARSGASYHLQLWAIWLLFSFFLKWK